jgi:LPS export ABC transporter protein LptC
MRRSRLRAALLTVVAAALAGIAVATWQNVTARRPRTIADLGADFVPEVAQHIQSFRRVKMKSGKLVWEVQAEDAQYFESDGQVVVRKPVVTFFLDDGTRRAQLVGNEGQLTLDGKELASVTLRGDVVLVIDDLELRTAEAFYDHAKDRISAPGAVTIHGKTLDVQGLGLEVEVTPRTMRLLSQVHTVVRSNAASS